MRAAAKEGSSSWKKNENPKTKKKAAPIQSLHDHLSELLSFTRGALTTALSFIPLPSLMTTNHLRLVLLCENQDIYMNSSSKKKVMVAQLS